MQLTLFNLSADGVPIDAKPPPTPEPPEDDIDRPCPSCCQYGCSGCDRPPPIFGKCVHCRQPMPLHGGVCWQCVDKGKPTMPTTAKPTIRPKRLRRPDCPEATAAFVPLQNVHE